MDPKLFATVFTSVFLAEMGDKTQVATILFASQSTSGRWTVFAAAASALVVVTAIGVAAGDFASRQVPARAIRRAAGLGFLVIGAWTLWKA